MRDEAEREQLLGVRGHEALADAVDVVGDELVVVEAGLQPQPIAVMDGRGPRRRRHVLLEGFDAVRELHLIEVIVHLFAEVRIGLIQIHRKRLELVVSARVFFRFGFFLLAQLGVVVFVAFRDARDLDLR